MRVELAQVNLEILKKLNKEYKISITYLANSCIYEKLGDKIKLLKEFDLSLSGDEIDLKVRLYEYEKEYLLNASKLTGINSLNGVIKYLILNSIYKKGFLSPNELKIIDELKSEINKIGINLHQILKKLNFKEEFKNDDLKILLEQLNEKIEITNNEIDLIPKYVNHRFKNTSIERLEHHQEPTTSTIQKSSGTIDISFDNLIKEFLDDLNKNLNQNIQKEVLTIKTGAFSNEKKELMVIHNPNSLFQNIKANFENKINKIKMEIIKND